MSGCTCIYILFLSTVCLKNTCNLCLELSLALICHILLFVSLLDTRVWCEISSCDSSKASTGESKKKNKTITNIQTGLDFWIILMIRHARITGVKQCIQYWTDSCRPLVTEASREARRRFVERWRGFLTHTQRTQNMIHWLKNYFEVFDVSGCQSGARLTD